jgi:hypothetical protein
MEIMAIYFFTLFIIGISWWFYPKTIDLYRLFFNVFFAVTSFYVMLKIAEWGLSFLVDKLPFELNVSATKLIVYLLFIFYGVYLGKSKLKNHRVKDR